MHRKYSNFLIVIFIGVILLGIYYYFYNNSSSEASSDSITSSLDTTADPLSANGDAKIAEDVSFLTKLIALKTIRIDTSLFQDQSFNKLVDNNIKLDYVSSGRVNPFSPIDKIIPNNQTTIIPTTKNIITPTNKSVKTN